MVYISVSKNITENELYEDLIESVNRYEYFNYIGDTSTKYRYQKYLKKIRMINSNSTEEDITGIGH
jgi:hypothetical protein